MGDTAQDRDLLARLEEANKTISLLEATVSNLQEEITRRDTDELTGTHNLRWLRETWDTLRIAAVAFIDVDSLKAVNDTYGHTTGDRVIAHVAAGLTASGCWAVRYGGDEFLILIPRDGRDVDRTMKGIVSTIAGCGVPVANGTIKVSVSCGVRVHRGEPLHQLIREADEAMYAVKRKRMGTPGYIVV